MGSWTEEEQRQLAFDYLRGDLEPDVEEAFEEHLLASEEFADYVSRLQELLQSPKKAESELMSAFDKGALFSKISAELHGDPFAKVVEFPRAPRQAPEDFDVDIDVPRSRTQYVVAAAALFGAAFLGFVLWDTGRPAPAPIQVVEDTSPAPLEPARAALAELQLGPASTPDVQVYASADSSWSLEGATDKSLKLNQGVVLVEFVPKQGEALEVATKNFNIRVLGTIFYASNEGEGSVGVVTGKVQVVPPTGEPIVLTTGQEYVGGIGVRPMVAKQIASAETYVSVDVHLDRLAEAVAVVDIPKKTRRPREAKRPAKKQLKPSIVWREQANKALRAGRFEDATNILEDALRDLDRSDPTRGAIRLDLSRIYISKLHRPSQAAVHLRRFVKSRPNDIATPTARAQLCRILRESGRTDPICGD